ncbi:unnamed protein product [Protopolystoma xenopodis]|uniref:Uncharacterized protein n=1 Tax=Protopolystoma xenopodis TaxID=117903 RepID=A0A3S5B8P2_9PLAT|nr:unnamed protein product [Protopolystoma xenopodis]
MTLGRFDMEKSYCVDGADETVKAWVVKRRKARRVVHIEVGGQQDGWMDELVGLDTGVRRVEVENTHFTDAQNENGIM